jgi:transposase-like protein
MHTPSTNRSKNHRFPAEIIRHAVWLYYRFCLSYRDGEERLFARGVIVSYEAIRWHTDGCWTRSRGSPNAKSWCLTPPVRP